MSAAPRCSVVADALGEPHGATATRYDVWLLIEHPGPWEHSAWGGIDLPADVRAGIDAALAAVDGRVQMMRRHGRGARHEERSAAPGRQWRWAVVDTRAGAGLPQWGTWAEPAGLAEVVPVLQALRAVAPAGDAATPASSPAAGARLEESLLLVCCHARHDQCCAVLGRPVVEALAREWPGVVMETSHLGGDRFAANLLVLPDGVMYGRLDPASAPGVVRAHFGLGCEPHVRVEHLRGFTTHDRPAQAALAEAHRVLGPLPPGAVRVTGEEALDDSTHRVELLAQGGREGRAAERLSVEVRAESRPPARLTCKAVKDTSAVTHTATITRRQAPVTRS